MKNQKLISRNAIRRYGEGGSEGGEPIYNPQMTSPLLSLMTGVKHEYSTYNPKPKIDNFWKVLYSFPLFMATTGQKINPLSSPAGTTLSINSLTNQSNVEKPSTGNYTYLQLRLKLSSMTDEELNNEADNKQRGYNVSFIGSELGRRRLEKLKKQLVRQLSSSSNNTRGEVLTTPEQKKEEIPTDPLDGLNINNLREEIKNYFRNGNPIETVKSEEDIDKWADSTVKYVFNQIEHIYNDPKLSLKISYTPKKEEQLTTTIAHTPSTPLNRAEIRALIERDLGINPYSISGSKRRLLREFINGDKEQDMSWVDKNSKLYNNWIAPFVVYKNKEGGLISRNVVDRFKSGGQIRKFDGGSLLTAQDIFRRRITNRRNTNLNTGRFDLYGDEAYTNTNSHNNTNTNTNTNTNSRNTNSRNTNTNSHNNTNNTSTSNTTTNTNNNTNRHTLHPSKTLFYGTRAYGNYDNTQLELIPDNIKILLLNTGFNSDGFNDVYDFQLALNDYFAMDGDINNQILVDGKWGQLTQRAFNMAMAKAQSKFPALEEDIINNTLVPSTFTTTINPIQVLPVPNYNRTQIRGLISSKGLNPYDYTAQLRRALRKYLNGESSDTSLLKGTNLEFLLNYGENK